MTKNTICRLIAILGIVASGSAAAFLGLPLTPPLILPFAVHQAGQTVTAEVRILDDRVYPFAMRFSVKKDDPDDLARVANLAGQYGKDKNGNLIKPGISIPLKLEIRSSDKKDGNILVNQIVMVGRMSSGSRDSVNRDIGVIRLAPGLYQIRVENLSDHPELQFTPITFEMYSRTRGGIFHWSTKQPSELMTKLLDQIQQKDLLNRLSVLNRLADNTPVPAHRSQDVESFTFPMPVGKWQGCMHHVFIFRGQADLFWLLKVCGGDDVQVYTGTRPVP